MIKLLLAPRKRAVTWCAASQKHRVETTSTPESRGSSWARLLRQSRFHEAQVETLVGYQALRKQANPGFLQAARKDLAAEYEGMHQPEEAAKYRAEHAAEANKVTNSKGH